jgi:hypothetical protein
MRILRASKTLTASAFLIPQQDTCDQLQHGL